MPRTIWSIVSSLEALLNSRECHAGYFDKEIDYLTKQDKGDWIGLHAAETVELHAGEFAIIPFGVGMILPKAMKPSSSYAAAPSKPSALLTAPILRKRKVCL